MTKKYKVLGIIFFGIMLIALSMSFLFSNPSFDLEKYTEINHSLFGKLDPILGYAHNEQYQSKNTDNELKIAFANGAYTHYANGFVGLAYRENDKPIRIVILGSSSTDPYLYEGNWPLKFHGLLVQKNIPHIIYNGAVSGYNSSQLVAKLQRDVFSLGKINLVISYLGGNDFVENEDIVENHPGIHPYQKKIFESIEDSISNDVSPWRRIKFVIHRLIDKQKNVVQLGVINSDYKLNFTNNIQYMKAICDINKTAYIHIMETVITNESQRISGTKLSSSNLDFEKSISHFLNETYFTLKKNNYVFSIQESMPKNRKIFYDSVHLSDEGNALLAAQILGLAQNLNGNPLLFR